MLVSPVEIEKLYQRFVTLDRDRSGTLSENELLIICPRYLNSLTNWSDESLSSKEGKSVAIIILLHL